MVTLVSPGVDVEIIDESFYGSAGPGTVPLVVIATAANKASPSGTGIAPYSAPAQASQLYLATSQRDLIQNFGTPTFEVVQGTPVQGYELNEYGLHAAYQFLGISNRCYVLRADIDLAQLASSTTAPVSPPAAGTYWLDLSSTTFGVFQSNGNPLPGKAWVTQPCIYAAAGSVVTVNNIDVPSPSLGTDGMFAVVVTMSNNLLYERISGTWYQVGSALWQAQYPTTVVGSANPQLLDAGNTVTDAMTINGVSVDLSQVPDGNGGFTASGGSLSETVTIINALAIPHITASISAATALVISNTAGGSITLANQTGTPLATYGLTSGTTNGVGFTETSDAQYPTGFAAGSVWVKGTSPNNGASWTVKLYNGTTGSWTVVPAPFYPFNALVQDGTAGKDQAAIAGLGTLTVGQVYIGYDVSHSGVIGTQQLRRWNGTNFTNLSYEAGTIAPTLPPAAGTYWFNSDFQVDIMYGNGSQWLGYQRKYPATDPNGVQIAGSAPTTQSGGGALVDNDLWLDSSQLENYPMLYRWDTSLMKWSLIDNTDNTSPFGIVFADARQDSGVNYTGNNNTSYLYQSTATADMLQSSFVDPDCPDPRTYPDGMLLWNTRYSNYNVKQWEPNYFLAGNFDPNTDYTQNSYNIGDNAVTFPPVSDAGRWVTASGNNVDGSPYMGRKAQRVMVVRALEAELTDNDDIRSELVYYNLIAAPGYPELMTEMVSLNTDQKNVAFIVGDTPIRMDPSGTSVTAWATNSKNVAATGEDGLTIANEYVGVYYPWGLSTDLSGNEVMIPPSTIALVTLAYNDQVAYPWYAPAGYNRGLVTNASSVGYLTAAGEFQPVILNPGQRDVLYTNAINPIAYIPGRGLVVYGQKTLYSDAAGSSALDRINVARLCNYLSYNLDNIVKPFLFEQNDAQTQSSALAVVSSFLNGLVGLQALSDYAVVCDSSNNTATRIDANELWIDVAVIPIHSIEFIYIPVRILNTGADLATAVSSTVSL